MAHEHFAIRPDIMTCGKALQVGATLSSRSWFPEEGSMSSTWGGGHVIDMMVGVETIRTIKKDRLLGKVKSRGRYLRKALMDLPKVKDVRGLGLMNAFDLSSTKERGKFIDACVRKGLVLLPCGLKGVRVIPPFIVEESDLDCTVQIMDEVLR